MWGCLSLHRLEERICTCGHKESMHVTGRKDGVGSCMDCIEEGISKEDLVECEGFIEKI